MVLWLLSGHTWPGGNTGTPTFLDISVGAEVACIEAEAEAVCVKTETGPPDLTVFETVAKGSFPDLAVSLDDPQGPQLNAL